MRAHDLKNYILFDSMRFLSLNYVLIYNFIFMGELEAENPGVTIIKAPNPAHVTEDVSNDIIAVLSAAILEIDASMDAEGSYPYQNTPVSSEEDCFLPPDDPTDILEAGSSGETLTPEDSQG